MAYKSTIYIDMEKVRQELDKRFWTVADLSRACGVSLPTLYALGSAHPRTASKMTLLKIAKALNMEPMELVKK